MFDAALILWFLVAVSGLLLLLRALYSAVARPATSWKRLTEIYPYEGQDPEQLSASAFGLMPVSMPFSTYATFTEQGLFLSMGGMSLESRAALVPWRNLRVDFSAGWLVIVEVAPENTQFAFTRWFVGGKNLRRIRKNGFRPQRS